jgi:hypothetical protein
MNGTHFVTRDDLTRIMTLAGDVIDDESTDEARREHARQVADFVNFSLMYDEFAIDGEELQPDWGMDGSSHYINQCEGFLRSLPPRVAARTTLKQMLVRRAAQLADNAEYSVTFRLDALGSYYRFMDELMQCVADYERERREGSREYYFS